MENDRPLGPSDQPRAWPRWERRSFPFAEHPLFHLTLFLLTFVTTTLVGGLAFTTRGGPLRGGSFSDGFPFSLPLLAILGAHELGHYAMCRRLGLAATLPYFLPSPFVGLFGELSFGTFGALIRIKEPIRRKSTLVDVGAAGPLAGFLASLPFLFYGVARAHPVTGIAPPGTVLFGYPPIVELAQKLTGVAPYTSAGVHEHPTFMAAWFGTLVTALNLLPVGQLDGGHVLRAALNRRQPFVSAAVVVLAAASAYWGATWAAFSLFAALVIGLHHPPVEDENTPLGLGRTLVALACLAVFLLCFCLVPIRIL